MIIAPMDERCNYASSGTLIGFVDEVLQVLTRAQATLSSAG